MFIIIWIMVMTSGVYMCVKIQFFKYLQFILHQLSLNKAVKNSPPSLPNKRKKERGLRKALKQIWSLASSVPGSPTGLVLFLGFPSALILPHFPSASAFISYCCVSSLWDQSFAVGTELSLSLKLLLCPQFAFCHFQI